MGEQRRQMTMLVRPQTGGRFAESSQALQALIPGIPDAIAVTHIAPKLRWREVRTLALVSAAWQRAVYSREVHRARIRARPTETFVLLCHDSSREAFVCPGCIAISVYTMEDKRSIQLPAIPYVKGGVPTECQCVSLDGKVYILGGRVDLGGGYREASKEVYELDVAGKWEWKRCADMQHTRMGFACVVKDEQIYVFGGWGGRKPLDESEVYDPKADTWSSIKPMMKLRSGHEATALGEDLVVHGGNSFEADRATYHAHRTLHLEVYHPGRNEWRVVVSRSRPDHREGIFLAHGKLHSMTWDGIYVLDTGMDEYTLTARHSSPFKETLSSQMISFRVTRAVNGELLALTTGFTSEVEDNYVFTLLMQSKGFGSENRKLVWEKASSSLSFRGVTTPLMCPIQL